MFRDREDAAHQLAERLSSRPLRDPIVLGIPRGGVIIAAVLARALKADLDVTLAQKLGVPGQPELALGAVGEDGQVHLIPEVRIHLDLPPDFVSRERKARMAQIGRKRDVYRAVRPPAPLAGRSIIVTDDGIATGATMIAALHVIAAQQPHERIVAVPVGAPERVDEVRRHCDEIICLRRPGDFRAISQYFADFRQVSEEEVLAVLREGGEW
jgi:putative phosphoribosyl transferase